MWIPTLLNGDRVKIVLGWRPLGLNGGKNRIVIPTTTAKRDERDGDVNSFTFSTKPTSKQQQENGINRTKIGRVRELWAVGVPLVYWCVVYRNYLDCLNELDLWNLNMVWVLARFKLQNISFCFFSTVYLCQTDFFKVSHGVRFLVNVENSQY